MSWSANLLGFVHFSRGGHNSSGNAHWMHMAVTPWFAKEIGSCSANMLSIVHFSGRWLFLKCDHDWMKKRRSCRFGSAQGTQAQKMMRMSSNKFLERKRSTSSENDENQKQSFFGAQKSHKLQKWWQTGAIFFFWSAKGAQAQEMDTWAF